jgi:hypothetical protein
MKKKQDVAEIIADALDRCVPGSVGFRNLSGCHRDRLLSKAIAAINAVQEAGYVIRPRKAALNATARDQTRHPPAGVAD